MNPLRLRALNKQWDDIDIVHDIGINRNTIKSLAKAIRAANGKRPLANRKTQVRELSGLVCQEGTGTEERVALNRVMRAPLEV